jgi:hypothetical protein
MSSDVATVVASVVASSATAALIASRAQRRAQFRERMLTVASDFAATTMRVLAALRRYKPTKPGVKRHRNAPLIKDHALRAKRYDDLQQSFDELRALRGRVRLHFPGVGDARSPVTIKADDIVGTLRIASDASEKFWKRCDEDPDKRREYEERFDREYHEARSQVWENLNEFCNTAANFADRRERGPSFGERLAYDLRRLFRSQPQSVASGADRPEPKFPAGAGTH